MEAPAEKEAGLPHALGGEEDEAAGTHSQDEVQPAHAQSKASAPWWEDWSGASRAFSCPPEKPIELMPELLH